ncbi:MAG: NifB/NifX family molybdenum-iron cluster-binding protein [Eggerthellaceae bacterium]|nr:NifB/NifX family molybdenum-iron cluster-binding protein [Eggerthellaceae bacterium]
MKLAIPSESDAGLMAVRSGHFGHAEYFTMVEIEDGQVKNVFAVKNVDHDTYGCGGVIQFAIDQNIDAILTAGMGVPPYTRFTNAGIAVYIDTTHPFVSDAVKDFLAGKTPRMQLDQACRH